MDFSLEDYESNVQNYMQTEWNAANVPMYKDETYVNWQKKAFLILEDSPIGSAYVKCRCEDKFGTYVGYRPKIVLVS